MQTILFHLMHTGNLFPITIVNEHLSSITEKKLKAIESRAYENADKTKIQILSEPRQLLLAHYASIL